MAESLDRMNHGKRNKGRGKKPGCGRCGAMLSSARLGTWAICPVCVRELRGSYRETVRKSAVL